MTDPFPGGFDPRIFEQVPFFRELAKLMRWQGGPVNWELAAQTARAVAGDEPPVGDRAAAEFADAVSAAELWLDQVTTLAAVDGPVRALSRHQWIDLATSPDGLGPYVEPIAAGMQQALGGALGGGGDLSDAIGGDQAGMAEALQRTMHATGAMLYGIQVGTIAGHLSDQLLGSYDLGVPTLDPRTVAIVGHATTRFADEFGFDPVELRYWLALREAAHRRQFAGVGWLGDHLATLLGRFAAEADFDPQRLMDQLGGLGPAQFDDPEALTEALARPDAFRLEPTSKQRQVLSELQAVVAFTAAWVDTVVAAAAADRLGALSRIEEALVRRRAAKGPGERFMEDLIGLDLKPQDVRLGRAFCTAVIDARGQEGLDRAWGAPERLPTGDELSEPSRWLVRMAGIEVDAELDEDGDGPTGS